MTTVNMLCCDYCSREYKSERWLNKHFLVCDKKKVFEIQKQQEINEKYEKILLKYNANGTPNAEAFNEICMQLAKTEYELNSTKEELEEFKENERSIMLGRFDVIQIDEYKD